MLFRSRRTLSLDFTTEGDRRRQGSPSKDAVDTYYVEYPVLMSDSPDKEAGTFVYDNYYA